MSATEVSICSNALLMLGAQPINDLTDDNDRARIASNLFESQRDAVLRAHPWNCAVKRVALAPDAVAPAFDWDYAFTLPSDFMRALSVGQDGAQDEFTIESGKLLCNVNPAYLRYVWRNENPATWDGLLVQAMELQMAAAMAYGITQSASLRDSLRQEVALFMKRARAVDGQDGSPEMLGNERWLAARF